MKSLLLANAACCLVLVGLIWTIQVVHYPLFARVGAQEWSQYHAEHSARITLLVGPLMLAEVGLSLALVAAAPEERRWLAVVSGALVGVVWGATALLSVPLHGRLAGAPDLGLVAALVQTNWVRTVAWTGRAGLLIGWLARGGDA
jgi:hypothetical protein